MTSKTEIKKVVIVGASGNLGSIVLSALQETNAFEITVLSRASSSAAFPTGVKVIKTSGSEPELVEVFKGQDAVISTVGATGFGDQKALIDAAVEAKVKRFIPSELSSNTQSDVVRQLVPVFEAKKAILDYLKEKESSGLTWTGLSGGALFDWGLRTGFLGFDLANKKATIWDDGKTAFSTTNQRDLGKAVVSILQHPAETANQYLYVATVITTQKEILEAFQKRSGAKWSIERVSTDEQIAKGRRLVSQGDFTGMFELVRASAWSNVPGIRSNYAVDEKLSNKLLAVPEGSVEETVKAVLV